MTKSNLKASTSLQSGSNHVAAAIGQEAIKLLVSGESQVQRGVSSAIVALYTAEIEGSVGLKPDLIANWPKMAIDTKDDKKQKRQAFEGILTNVFGLQVVHDENPKTGEETERYTLALSDKTPFANVNALRNRFQKATYGASGAIFYTRKLNMMAKKANSSIPADLGPLFKRDEKGNTWMVRADYATTLEYTGKAKKGEKTAESEQVRKYICGPSGNMATLYATYIPFGSYKSPRLSIDGCQVEHVVQLGKQHAGIVTEERGVTETDKEIKESLRKEKASDLIHAYTLKVTGTSEARAINTIVTELKALFMAQPVAYARAISAVVRDKDSRDVIESLTAKEMEVIEMAGDDIVQTLQELNKPEEEAEVTGKGTNVRQITNKQAAANA